MHKDTIDIVVIGDRMVDVGLHVTLYSLLERSSYGFHQIFYITKGFNDAVAARLRETLSAFEDAYELQVIEHDGEAFSKYQGLHGNTFTYSKLLISEWVDRDYVLYLDTDIVVNMDISGLRPHFNAIDKFLVMANAERTLDQCLEREFFLNELKLNHRKYYNAGVLLLNLKKWRETNLPERLIQFANQYGSELRCADQTVINGVLEETDIGPLPEIFNVRLENHLPRKTYQDMEGILHFYGRPKPWDLFASMIHPHYKIFHKVLEKTSYKGYPGLGDIDGQRFRKFLRTYKSYAKTIFRIKV